MPTTIKPRNTYSPSNGSRTSIDYSDIPSLTVQEQKEASDINNIIRRFQKTGLIEHVNENEQYYGEFGNYSYHEHLNMVNKIQDSFQELPSDVRKQFNNDPQQWVEHLANPDNIADMRDGEIDNPVDLSTQSDEAATPARGSADEAEN